MTLLKVNLFGFYYAVEGGALLLLIPGTTINNTTACQHNIGDYMVGVRCTLHNNLAVTVTKRLT